METRKIKLEIETYGRAPAKFGVDAYKVGFVERVLMVRWGWAYAGSGSGYEYVRAPGGKAGRKVIIEVEVPTDEEILRLAMEMHSNRERRVTQISGFIVEYRPHGHVMYSYKETGAIYADGMVDPPGDEHVVQSEAAEFKFGFEAPWGVTLVWDHGDDHEATWNRDEKGLVD